MEAVFTYKSNWWGYISKHVLIAVVAFFIISFMIFLTIPSYYPNKEFSWEQLKDTGLKGPELYSFIVEKSGLYDPIPVLYYRWLDHVIRGDFGESIIGESYYSK